MQVKKKRKRGLYLTLPGGKQEPGETLEDCLIRECMEEIDSRVAIKKLLHIAEVMKPKYDGIRHQVDVLFECELPQSYEPKLGPKPDPSQIDTIWAALSDEDSRMYPPYAKILMGPDAPVYLGVFDG